LKKNSVFSSVDISSLYWCNQTENLVLFKCCSCYTWHDLYTTGMVRGLH